MTGRVVAKEGAEKRDVRWLQRDPIINGDKERQGQEMKEGGKRGVFLLSPAFWRLL